MTWYVARDLAGVLKVYSPRGVLAVDTPILAEFESWAEAAEYVRNEGETADE